MSKHTYFWPTFLAITFILGLVLIVMGGDQPTALAWTGLVLVSISPVILVVHFFHRYGP